MSQFPLSAQGAAFERFPPLFSRDFDLIRSAPLGESIVKAGLTNREAYTSLIQCVYIHMSNQLDAPYRLYPRSERTRLPLHIQYDGSVEHVLHLIRCIYSAIPPHMRRMFSRSVRCALIPEERTWNFLFATDAKAKDGFYVIPPAPGNPGHEENNVVSGLGGRAAQTLENSYISYAARYLDPELFEPFFEGLDACAKALGDADASNDKILNIAWKYFWNQDTLQWDAKRWDRSAGKFSLREDIPHDELKRLLSNIFSYEIYSGGLASLVFQIVETVGEDNLTEVLQKKWKKYKYRREQLAAHHAAAVKRLLEIPPSKTSDKTLEEAFSKYSQTPKILLSYCNALLKLEPVSWDSLKDVRMAIKFIPDSDNLKSLLYVKANDLCCENILNGSNPVLALHEFEQAARMALKNPHELQALLDNMRALYWNAFEWSGFDFRKADEYKTFQIERQENKIPAASAALALLQLAEKYIPNDESNFLWIVHWYFRKFEGDITPADRLIIINKLSEYLKSEVRKRGALWPYQYEDWIKWASYVNVGRDYIDVLRALYEALTPFDVSKLLITCRLFRNRMSTLWNPEGLGDKERLGLIGLVQSSCIQNDWKTPVPLDLWLFIGEQTCKNPFDIFDNFFDAYRGGAFRKEPAIFRQNPAEVVRDSAEMALPSVGEQARIYVGKAKYKKPRDMVNKWLKELFRRKNSPKLSDHTITFLFEHQ